MKTETLTLASPVDSLELSLLVIEPDSDIKGVFQLVHGMAEMKERYIAFMEYLASQGYACIIHDHRGHGESLKSKDDLGYMYKAGGHGLVEDVHAVTSYAKGRWPEKPVVLFGHSMGSLVVRCVVKKYDADYAALIVMGSPARNGAASVGRTLTKVKSAIQGAHHRSKMITSMAFGSYLKNIPNARTPFDWLSVNEANVDRYIESETCGYMFTLDGYKGLFDVLIDTYDPKGWAMANPAMPVLFLSGSEDPCIDGKKNFYDAITFMKERGYEDVENRFYKGLRHEILNEDAKEQVYQDITGWLIARGL